MEESLIINVNKLNDMVCLQDIAIKNIVEESDRAESRNEAIFGIILALNACVNDDNILKDMPNDFVKQSINYLYALASDNRLFFDSLMLELEAIVKKNTVQS